MDLVHKYSKHFRFERLQYPDILAAVFHAVNQEIR